MDYIFHNIWLKADVLGDFEPSLFSGNDELEVIIRYMYYSDKIPKYGKEFVENVKVVFELCKNLTNSERRKLCYWYQVNNQIEKLCDGTYQPVLYDDLEIFNPNLKKAIKSIYDNLYEQSKIGLKKISEHYNEFVKINKKGICPFCGIYPMDGQYSKTREPYDHFLPKSLYPFTSINLKNLVPMCHKCNSGYKMTKSPIFDSSKNRRKAYYPYGAIADITINVSLKSNNIQNLEPNDISLIISSTEQEKVDTWQELFGIDARYKALFCEGDGKDWMQQIIETAPYFGMTEMDYLDTIKKQFKENPYKDKKFLKVPFLDACTTIGIF